MSTNYARPLATNELTVQFLTRVLGYKECLDTSNLAVKVAKAEVLLSVMTGDDTLTSRKYRHPTYCTDSERARLREEIFKELITLPRPPNDDDIAPTVGGMLPLTEGGVKREKKAFLLIGLPASGKSSISNKIADMYGAYIIDSDYAKRKFPEYTEEYGAAVVHEESTLITFGHTGRKYSDEPNVLEYCVAEGINLVIPKIGASVDSIKTLRDLLISHKYDVHLTLIRVDRLSATQRALKRFCSTKRYVPISLVFDGYSNDPIVTYYYTRDESTWKSVGAVSTEGSVPAYIEGPKENPAHIYR